MIEERPGGLPEERHADLLFPGEEKLERGWEEELRALVAAGRVVTARERVSILAQKAPRSGAVAEWVRTLAPTRIRGTSPAAGETFRLAEQWLAAHRQEFAGCWVLLDEEKVIDHDIDQTSLLRRRHRRLEGLALRYVEPTP